MRPRRGVAGKPPATRGKPASPRARERAVRRPDAGYYQALHDTNAGYQTHNWLVEELPALLALGGDSILDVGCGNGLFLAHAAAHWRDVTGADWVRSPVLERVLREHPAVRFLQQDATALEPGRRFGLLASADFLEHVAPAALPGLIRRLHALADVGYHRIACYDDGHSHLSIFDARSWLRIFAEACPGAGYRIVKQAYRKAGRQKPEVVISNSHPPARAGGLRLDVGCGEKVRPGHVGVDVRALPGVGIVCNAWELDRQVEAGSVEAIYCRHFLEHLTYAQGERTLRVFRHVLRPGGALQVIVPDMRYHLKQFLDAGPATPSEAGRGWSARKHALASLWGWQREGDRELWDVHKSGYDLALLTEVLEKAGFTGVRRLPERPWHLSVAAVCAGTAGSHPEARTDGEKR